MGVLRDRENGAFSIATNSISAFFQCLQACLRDRRSQNATIPSVEGPLGYVDVKGGFCTASRSPPGY